MGDAGCRILVADIRQHPPFADCSAEIVDVGEASSDCSRASLELPPVDPDQLAYVIYTSGSTGQAQRGHGQSSQCLEHDPRRESAAFRYRAGQPGSGTVVARF